MRRRMYLKPIRLGCHLLRLSVSTVPSSFSSSSTIRAAMDVTITREPKVAKADHLFVLIAEGSKPDVAVAAKAMQAIAAAGFSGRADESLSTVAGEPKKITLVGVGKAEA